jgi:hypothetical protein
MKKIWLTRCGKHHFNGQESIKVESLNEHFDGLQIHDSDIFWIIAVIGSDEDFISVKFVRRRCKFERAVAKVAQKVERNWTCV